MNKVLLVGRISQDVKEITFDNGGVKSSFSIATSDSYKDKDGVWQEVTDFHNIVLFKATKLIKGDLIEVEGRLKTRSYEVEGSKRYITEVVAERTALLSRPDKNREAKEVVPDPKAQHVYEPKPVQAQSPTQSNLDDEDIDDLPF